jgi:membrane protease YdiL (CAAX protease family)
MTDESSRSWSFEDLALMLGALLPTLLAATLVTRTAKYVLPAWFSQRVVEVFFFQTAFYVFTLLALYLVITFKRRQPFFSALHWTFRFHGSMWCVLVGPVLMVATSAMGAAMKAPIIPNPWEDLITSKASQLVVIVFATVLGPIWEELLFRGFLFPLLERYIGTWPAIIGSAIPFGLIHGSQNQWAWQYVVIIAMTGVAFAYVRHKTGSTAASALTHSAYNATQFIFFLLQNA